jgi:MarR family transcriptional regulator for hemolysin
MKKYDYENSIGFIVYSLSKTFQKAFDVVLQIKLNITLTQSKVIFFLYKYSGITLKELADKMGVESPTLVPIIDKMEEDGYLKRKLDSSDRRIKRIYTTSKTDSLWNSMLECASQLRKVAVKDVSEQDIKSTLKVIKKITENLTLHLGESETPLMTMTKD